jgi:prefoldin subunit 5
MWAMAEPEGIAGLDTSVAHPARVYDEQMSELAARHGALREQIRKLAETAQRLEARIPKRR